jgi:cysteinyl-tRNA synthetase
MDADKLTTSDANKILDFLKQVNLVLKVFSFETEETDKKKKGKMPEKEILEMIKKRNELREKKEWEEADIIRLSLQKKGIVLYDTKEGTTWSYE